MNQTIQTILNRTSTKKYKSDPIPQEILDEIIKAGTYAATGRNRQAPIILAITNRQVRDELAKLNAKIMGMDESFDPFYNAPVVLVVLAKKDVNHNDTIKLGCNVVLTKSSKNHTALIHENKV